MIAPTHLAAGQTAYLAACLLAGHPPNAAEAAAALAASQIPDLDTQTSYAGRILPPLSDWIEHQFGHRTLTHSALFATAAILLAWLLLPRGYVLAISAGLISHAFLDMMTPGGVCWFWPSRARCVLPANVKYRMETAGPGELGFLIVMVALGLGMMPLAESGKGPSGLIRSAIGSLGAARQEFDGAKGDWAYQLDIQGRDNRTYADISGTYPVIGPWGESGFLLDAQGPITLCASGGTACDWYAATARLKRDGAQRTTSHRIDRDQISAAALAAALDEQAATGTVYLIGNLLAPGAAADPPTITVTEQGRTMLAYATPAQLTDWAARDLLLRDAHVTVQVRHAPDANPPALDLPETAPTPTAPGLLERWLPTEEKP